MNRFTFFPRRTQRVIENPRRRALLAVVAPLIFGISLPMLAQTPATTTTTMTLTSGGSAVSSVSSGTVITLMATVLAGATPVTHGLVNFCDATASYCEDVHTVGSAQLTSAGTAIFKFRPGSGSRSYKALFVGTNTNAGSVSAATALMVTGPSPTTISIASSGSPGNFTLAATVGGAHSTAPAGTVSFLDTSNNDAVLATASLGAGTGVFQFVNSSNPAIPSGVNEPNGLGVADFNGDGIPDFAVTGGNAANPVVTVFLGAADGTFSPVATSLTVNPNYSESIPTSVLVADFDGDGIPDLLLGCTNSGDVPVPPPCPLTVLLGKGDGTFTAAPSPGSGGVQTIYAVGDFNGDGVPDIAVAYYDIESNQPGEVLVLFGKGDGTFPSNTTVPISGFVPWSIAVADFNGDGIMDLAISDEKAKSLSIFLGNADASLTALPAISLPGTPGAIAPADFNGDGIQDLALVIDPTPNPYVLLGNGNGTFTAVPADSTLNISGITLTVGDFNGDGVANLATVDSTQAGDSWDTTAYVLLSDENGTFVDPAGELAYAFGAWNFDNNSSSSQVAAGDFNGDGVTDVVAFGSSVATDVLLRENTATATATGVSLAAGTHLIEASYQGDAGDSASISGTVQIVVPGTATTLTLTSSTASLTYGSAITLTATLSPSVSGTTNSNGETITFYNGSSALGTGTLVAGVAKFTTNFLPAGTDSITAIYAGDSALVNSTSAPLPIVVSQPTLTVTANNASRPLGAANPPLTGTVTGAVNGDTFTVTATTTATQSSPVGTYPIVPVASGPDLSNYIVNIVDGVLTVTLPLPTISAVSASANPAMTGTAVTFTVSVTSANGTPTGTVTFLDGTTTLGTGTLSGGGTAAYTTSSLAAGTHSITASYSGDTNFGAVTSAVLSEVIESFSVGGSSGGSTTQTASPGGTATYGLSVTPPTVGSPITFSVTGLPTGATATFTPSTVAAGAGPTTVSLVVTLPSTAAAQPARSLFGNGAIPISLGLILLPFAGRLRKGSRRWVWVVVLGLAGLAAMGACGGGGNSGGGGGGGTPQNYTLTVTATSGTLTQTTTLTLIVN